jgi:hypothetical protein
MKTVYVGQLCIPIRHRQALQDANTQALTACTGKRGEAQAGGPGTQGRGEIITRHAGLTAGAAMQDLRGQHDSRTAVRRAQRCTTGAVMYEQRTSLVSVSVSAQRVSVTVPTVPWLLL